MKHNSAGSTIAYGAAVGAAAAVLPGVDVFTTLGQVESIGGPSLSKPNLDVTDLASTAREFISDLAEPGAVTIEVFWDGAAADHQAMFADAATTDRVRNFRITLADDTNPASRSVLDFRAEVLEWSLSLEKGSAQKASLSLQITGPVTPTWHA